jgi:hypothetical protein
MCTGRMVLQQYDERHNQGFGLGSAPLRKMLSMLKEANKADTTGMDVPAHSNGEAGSEEGVPAQSNGVSEEEGRLPVTH